MNYLSSGAGFLLSTVPVIYTCQRTFLKLLLANNVNHNGSAKRSKHMKHLLWNTWETFGTIPILRESHHLWSQNLQPTETNTSHLPVCQRIILQPETFQAIGTSFNFSALFWIKKPYDGFGTPKRSREIFVCWITLKKNKNTMWYKILLYWFIIIPIKTGQYNPLYTLNNNQLLFSLLYGTV